ncbi:MAG: ATPase domain-containing protein [Candidatus Diapherotrites archaeon]
MDGDLGHVERYAQAAAKLRLVQEYDAVYSLLNGDWSSVPELVYQSQLSQDRVSSILEHFETQGLAEKHLSGRSTLYRKKRSKKGEAAYTEPDRVKSGIPGLDEALHGGMYPGNVVVFSGEPGSGKTTACLQFLHSGAKEGEPGVYVSLEGEVRQLLNYSRQFGWDFKTLIDRQKVRFLSANLHNFDQLMFAIEDAVTEVRAKRVVIDPGIMFRLFFSDELTARKRLQFLGQMLKSKGCTTIITNEFSSFQGEKSLFGLEEYVADGVVLLQNRLEGDRFVRKMGVLKMRGTRTSDRIHKLELTKHGLRMVQ